MAPSSPSRSPSPNTHPLSKKRKRAVPAFSELEVNVSAPEPASKKALRNAKKGKDTKKPAAEVLLKFDDTVATRKRTGSPVHESESSEDTTQITTAVATPAPKRSEHGIWIGNLHFSVTKDDLAAFLSSNASIAAKDVTRIHLPASTRGRDSLPGQNRRSQNKGFAYVDFATSSAQRHALDLSETLLSGRKVLIKDAKSFEGRPEPKKDSNGFKEGGKEGHNPPNKRIFVGNLEFDTTEDELRQHFSRCGEITSVFVATFEDSGNCKGYAWVTFSEVEEAERAVRGWVEIQADKNGEDDEESDADNGGNSLKRSRKNGKKEKKPRKWWVNRLKGRTLRMEFAEDQTVRYQKRFGKGKKDENSGNGVNEAKLEAKQENGVGLIDHGRNTITDGNRIRPKRQEEGYRTKTKPDARTIKPGAALATAPRATAAIVEGKGKKITFD